MSRQRSWIVISLLLFGASAGAQDLARLPGSQALTMQGDLSAQMVAGIDKFLTHKTTDSVAGRKAYWHRDFSSPQAYQQSVEPNRQRLRRCIGAVDPRVPIKALEYVETTATPALIAETDRYTVRTVRWPVFAGVFGEGLLLEPKTPVQARVVAIPDADQTPEMLVGLAPGVAPASQLARRLAENGCQVIVPVLIDRRDNWSGNPQVRMTNQPHREWVYRMAFEMGRHIIGYEVQKVLALVDWLAMTAKEKDPYIALAGYAEGGLIAFYSAALDTRIDACLVSGYFEPREGLWQEPIYRNVFGLLGEFGDAEIARYLIYPRTLVVEHSETPQITGPPPARQGRAGAAPGRLRTPSLETVKSEVRRQAVPISGISPIDNIVLVHGQDQHTVPFGSEPALAAMLKPRDATIAVPISARVPKDRRRDFDPDARQRRQLEQLVEHTQRLLRFSEYVRQDFWKKAKPKSVEAWQKACQEYRRVFWEEVIGRIPDPLLPKQVRTRRVFDKPKWTGYEVVFDVWPDVFAWGYLLVPKDIKPGERRPTVVCQHGLEGVPMDVITDDPKERAFRYYKAFAARLAEQGFVTYAPHNPYRGGDRFRVLQRKANPLGQSLFSVIVGQHQQLLDWLAGLPFVDRERIGFYGLSYGGKSAMRLPAILEGYALSICSADFDEWVKKNVTVDARYSYMFTGEYEMFEFDLGHTFNYAEMANLIAPRPFMVERGHTDGVAPDEWVAYEYAKVRRLYAFLGIPERTTIEYFNGPHSIHGVGTFQFLHQQLRWP